MQQILSLKQLGFSLEEIKETMENSNFNPIRVIKIQLETVKKQMEVQEQLYRRLESMYELLETQQEVQPEQFIKLIEVITMSEKYFTQEQLEKMKNRHFSPEEKKEIDNQWTELIAKIRKELENKTPANHPDAIKLANRWQELTTRLAGGDPGIVKAAEHFYAENPNNALQYGVDGELYKYIKKAMSHI
nr:TipAS antibiotic-recognition domain-containing protein [Neobacillus cucumis]